MMMMMGFVRSLNCNLLVRGTLAVLYGNWDNYRHLLSVSELKSTRRKRSGKKRSVDGQDWCEKCKQEGFKNLQIGRAHV